MTFKQKFENHPIIFGLTLLIVGWGAGIAFFKNFPGLGGLTTACYVEGYPSHWSSLLRDSWHR